MWGVLEMEEKLKSLIEHGFENEFLDYKAKMYQSKGSVEFIKDVLAMANSNYVGSKYILIGVKEEVLSRQKTIIGIEYEKIVDAAVFQQLILHNIEPDLQIQLHYINYREKTLALYEINGQNRPYLTKKQNQNLSKGVCYIRKGSVNEIATRADFDTMYQQKTGKFELKMLSNMLRAVNDKDGLAYLDVSFKNLTDGPITIMGGVLHIKNSNEEILSSHRIYGLKTYVGADFRLEIQGKREETGDLQLGFSSSDVQRLNMDEYGTTEEKLNFELIIWDSSGQEYHHTKEDGYVYAKGEFLWKVKINKSKVRKSSRLFN